MTFAAEWCTTNEVVILRCESASLFVVVNEWQYKDILDDRDKLTWEEMSEDWNACLSERSTSPASWRHDLLVNLVGAGTQLRHISENGSWYCLATTPTTDRGTLSRRHSRSEVDQSGFVRATASLSDLMVVWTWIGRSLNLEET